MGSGGFALPFFFAHFLEIIMKKRLKAFIKDQSGATAIEYALLAAGIAAVIITSVQILGDNTNSMFKLIHFKDFSGSDLERGF